MPHGSIRDYLHRAFCAAVPVGYRDGPPEGCTIFRDHREIRQPLALQARPSHLMGASWRGRLVEGGIQAQAGYEGDRFSEFAAALEQFERGVSAIGDGYYLSVWVPASHQQKQLPRPFGQFLVVLAKLSGVTLGIGQSRKKRQGPKTRGPSGTNASTSNLRSVRLAALPDHTARLRTRW